MVQQQAMAYILKHSVKYLFFVGKIFRVRVLLSDDILCF